MFLIAVILCAAMLAIMPTLDIVVNYANTWLQMMFIFGNWAATSPQIEKLIDEVEA